MLAVQRAPRMGSSQPPPDPYLPFGYAVDTDQEPLIEPPEPAPGAPLLTETDNKFLSSFFENMTSNQYNMPSFGEGLNFSDAWLNLPPQFMGTATSFGQQPGPSAVSPDTQSLPGEQFDYSRMLPGAHAMPPPPPPPLQQQQQLSPTTTQHLVQHSQHTDDVLTAAATLIQNGAASRGVTATSNGFGPPRRSAGPPVGHLRHQALEEFKEENRRSMVSQENDNTFTDWMWGALERRQEPRHPVVTGGLQWGSDSNFSPIQGYTSTLSKESAESMQQEQLKVLECFEVSKSAATTRPSSPVNGHRQAVPKDAGHKTFDLAQKRDDGDAPPRKRRKSKNNKEEAVDDEEDDAAEFKASRRRKSKAERTATPSSPPAEGSGAGKRRKSTVNGAKPPRENLSEEQKRENHIRSEQKRRTLIKEGFDDLCDLVPGLKGGGFSKSTMLAMAAEWLEELLKGNEALAAQLSTLERR